MQSPLDPGQQVHAVLHPMGSGHSAAFKA